MVWLVTFATIVLQITTFLLLDKETIITVKNNLTFNPQHCKKKKRANSASSRLYAIFTQKHLVVHSLQLGIQRSIRKSYHDQM